MFTNVPLLTGLGIYEALSDYLSEVENAQDSGGISLGGGREEKEQVEGDTASA